MPKNISLCRIVGLVGILLSSLVSAEEVNIVYTRAFAGEAYGYYHVEVLKAAMKATREMGAVNVEPHSHPMPQARQLLTLLKGEGDIMWSATNDEREALLIPIRLPLLQGLAGYRVFVIAKDNQPTFPASMSALQLKQKVAVQGIDWPDLAVLQRNGYAVNGADWSEWFTSMFNMVQRGVVDYFPRNVIEVSNDLARHKDKSVILEQNHMLHYANYEYFFVRPDKPELVARLKEGLRRILLNGELETLFLKYPLHKHALALANSPSRQTHELANPELSYHLADPMWMKDPAPSIAVLMAAEPPQN